MQCSGMTRSCTQQRGAERDGERRWKHTYLATWHIVKAAFPFLYVRVKSKAALASHGLHVRLSQTSSHASHAAHSWDTVVVDADPDADVDAIGGMCTRRIEVL